MDLVSSTLDRYIKHRFNGNGPETNVVINETNLDNDYELPTIYDISIQNIRPSCVCIREDLKYFAAGFENSAIHLWCLELDKSTLCSISPSFKLLAHTGSVYSIEFIQNNDLMLSCSEDTTIRLWCLKTKCNLIVYRGHNYPVWSIAVGSRGKLFASASMDATSRLWQLDRIAPIRIFCGHDEDVDCVTFHPNEKYVATGSSDNTVRLWSVCDGKMVRLMVGHRQPIIGLSFLPDGKFLASASRDGALKVWNLATNMVTSELTAPASMSISFSPDQRFVATCGRDSRLYLWQVDKSKLMKLETSNGQTDHAKVISSIFHKENKLFSISFRENEIQQKQ